MFSMYQYVSPNKIRTYNSGTKLADISAMSMSDVLIIYLALGAPVAMFRFFQCERPFSYRGLASVLATFLFWPFSVIDLIFRSRRNVPDASIFVTRNEVDVSIIDDVEYLKEEILSALASDDERQVVSSKAEALERYVGLSLADTNSSFNIAKELFSVAGHPDEMIAVRCHARRNLRRLDRHRRDSAADVIEELTGPKGNSAAGNKSLEKLGMIAELLGDTETAANALKACASSRTAGSNADVLDTNPMWNSSSRKAIRKRAA